MLVVAIATTLGCGGSNHNAAADAPFAYDTTAPLRYSDRGVVNKGYPIAVHDASFSVPGDSRRDARRTTGQGPVPVAL